MSEEELNAMKADILSSVQRIGTRWGVNLSDIEFQKTELGTKMLGQVLQSSLGKYPTIDQQKEVLNVGLGELGKMHGVEVNPAYFAGDSVLQGMIDSGAIPKGDVKFKGWPLGSFTKNPAAQLFKILKAAPEISIFSGLHELDEDKLGSFNPQ